MFDAVLVANRGEIALRIHRACRLLGLRTIAVFSEPDATLRHVQLADAALCIGGASARDSYLRAEEIVLAARATGAGAIHPGYGFLSENARFARLVEDSGLVFIGPRPETIGLMGDKVRARQAMRDAGIPCVPGSDDALPDNEDRCRELAQAIGYPLIVKASGGGGGRGMRVVRDPASLSTAIGTTRAEAGRAFNNADVYLERFLETPRHIEIQVLADQHGNAVWLGERDCSIQRRHQKILEEAPATGIGREQIDELGRQCVSACLAIGYRGAGTFEFLYEAGAFHFIEMNTRIQVEHPVTELATGIDIVAEQLRIAMGLPLGLSQQDVQTSGHCIECRINAESPWDFRPSPGTIDQWRAPGGPGVRVESHLYPGYEVPGAYDSLIAKVVVRGANRGEAIARMRAALDETVITGIPSNLDLHRTLLQDPRFSDGECDIHFLERWLEARGRSLKHAA